MDTRYLSWKQLWARTVTLAFTFVIAGPTFAGDSDWMQDNLYRFRNNDLKVLSMPASHDAGMYKQDIDRFEIGVEDLHAYVSLSGPLVPDVDWGFSETGILEAGVLLSIIDELMGVIRDIDSQCINIVDVIEFCTTFGLEELVWDWAEPYYKLATETPENLSITQNLDLHGQLMSGVRRFDLRPKALGGTLYIHHSQAGIEGFGENLDYEKRLDIDVPCVERPWPFSGCITGTGRSYYLGTFAVGAGGAVRSVSSTGPTVNEVLADVREYMLEDHRELVILNFASYWAGWQGEEFNEADYEKLIGAIEAELAPWLLHENMLPAKPGLSAKERLQTTRLVDLIDDQGRIIVNLGNGSFVVTDPERGLWPASAISAGGRYANSDDLDTMREYQRNKWYDATSNRFGLWWTLTCQEGSFDCSVRDLAARANPELPTFVDSLVIPNANGNNINEIWVDFSEETAATEIAIALNPIAATIDIKPGNTENIINPRQKGVIWVAVLSDSEGLADPLQIDVSDVRFGPEGARPDRHKVSDVDRDGAPDLLLRFRMPAVGLNCRDSDATLTGHTASGQRFVGIDSISTAGCRVGHWRKPK